MYLGIRGSVGMIVIRLLQLTVEAAQARETPYHSGDDGGGPGLMQAANEGAAASGGQVQSMGIRVDLPFEQEVNAFVRMAFEHRTFFTRLHQSVLASDAFIVAPGGIATVLETMMIWQLLQVRHLTDAALILVWSYVAGPRRMGARVHALHRPAIGESGGHEHSAVRRVRRRGHRGASGASRALAPRACGLRARR